MLLYISFFLSLWSSLLALMSLATQLLYRAGHVVLQKQVVGVPGEASPPIHTAAIAMLSIILFFAPIIASFVTARMRMKKIGHAEVLVIASFMLNGFSLVYGVFAIMVFATG